MYIYRSNPMIYGDAMCGLGYCWYLAKWWEFVRPRYGTSALANATTATTNSNSSGSDPWHSHGPWTKPDDLLDLMDEFLCRCPIRCCIWMHLELAQGSTVIDSRWFCLLGPCTSVLGRCVFNMRISRWGMCWSWDVIPKKLWLVTFLAPA